MYDGPERATEDILSVYVVLNGTLGMSPGKAAAQSFHIGWVLASGIEALNWAYLNEVYPDWIDGRKVSKILDRNFQWLTQGRRVVTRLAETENVWERAKQELDGFLTLDEGMTEVEHGAETALVTFPMYRDEIPKILTHKRLQLYRG